MYEEMIQALQLHCEAGKKMGLNGKIWTLLGDASSALEALTAQLAAIQAENAQLRMQHRTEHCEAAGYDCAELAGLKAALARVEAERDSAANDVPHDCEHCKHAVGSGACKLLPDGDQFSPDYTEGFDRDGNCDHWDWCSAQGEG